MAGNPSALACLAECGVDVASLKAQAAKLRNNDPAMAADSESAAHLVAGVVSGPVLVNLSNLLALELFPPVKAKK